MQSAEMTCRYSKEGRAGWDPAVGQVKGEGIVTRNIADMALDMLKVDANGFDSMDRRLLLAMIEKYDGGPVGIDSLAASVGEESHTLEDVYEPYLIQQGFIMRTSRGRLATRLAYEHFGLKIPETRDSLSDLLDDENQ